MVRQRGRKALADAAYQQMMTLPFYNSFFQTTNVPAVKLATKLASPYGRLLPTLIDAAHRDPEFAALQRSFAERRRSEALQQCGVSLAASGLPPEVDLVVLADQLAGALYLRHLVSLQPIDEEFLDALVQNVLGDAPEAVSYTHLTLPTNREG